MNDKAKAEVVLDVELLQLSTEEAPRPRGRSSRPYVPHHGRHGDGAATASAVTSLPWNELLKLSLSDFNFTVPSIIINFIKTNTDAEILAKPQLRIAEGEKAQLVIGNRVPIPVTTINTQQAIGQIGVVPVTSFQYQDVGIKLDVETRVHHNKEVSLKLTVEVSNLNGYVPRLERPRSSRSSATRTITSNIRLKDGETSFLAGLVQTTKQISKTGLPFLADLPAHRPALLDRPKTEDDRNDIFLTLTPHITRAPQIDEEDLIPIWVGTENNVSFSGLNVRLESPQAPATPFDSPAEPPASRPVAPTNPVPSTVPIPGPSRSRGPARTTRSARRRRRRRRRRPRAAAEAAAASSGNAAPASSSFVETRGPATAAPSASRSRTPSCPRARRRS